MTKIKSRKFAKKIAAVSVCAVMAISCLAISASAADTRYSFDTDYVGSGSDWWLNKYEKVYEDITVSCAKKEAKAEMQLWQKNFLAADTLCERNQTITVGSGHRVWWYGNRTSDAQYHVTARVSSNNNCTVAFTGYLHTLG